MTCQVGDTSCQHTALAPVLLHRNQAAVASVVPLHEHPGMIKPFTSRSRPYMLGCSILFLLLFAIEASGPHFERSLKQFRVIAHDHARVPLWAYLHATLLQEF